MKYKALMLDVDGTLIPYDYYVLPSAKVVEAVKKAQEKVTVCLVTGRAYEPIRHILKKLGLHSGYAVVNNGANVVEIGTEKLLYDQPIEKEDVVTIAKALREENIEFQAKPNYNDPESKEEENAESVYMFYSLDTQPHDKINRLFNKISHLPHITKYKTFHGNTEAGGFNVSHVNATKLHGIETIMKKLHLQKEEIIGVGDSYNDFPLLMACGLKVAMGNAKGDLKEIADYVAPPVTEDGVVDVIEKFILSSK